MYNALLDRVVKVITTSAELIKSKDVTPEKSDFYNQLFAPEIYEEKRRKEQKVENIRNGLIVGATTLAVVGEIYHIGKRSGVVKKILKR